MLWYFLRGSRLLFIVSIVAAILLTGFEMIMPQITSFTIDSVIGDKAPELSAGLNRLYEALGGREGLRAALWIPALLIVILGVFNVLGRYVNQYYNAKASETLLYRMRRTLFSHIQSLPYDWHMTHKTGDIIQRCTSDINVIRNFVSEQLTSVFRIVVLLVFSLVCMFGIHPGLAWISLAFVPIIVIYSLVFRAKIAHLFLECDESEGALSAIAQENLTGVRVVRAFGREEYERRRFAGENDKWTSLWLRLGRLLGLFWSSGDLISGLQIMAVVIVGAVFSVRGEMTAGNYVAFISYNAMLVWPVRQLGRVISEMSKAGVSLDRIREIMNAAPETDLPEAQDAPMTGDIVFSHVSYAYEKEVPVLRDVSFTIRGGSVFGILGSTGSGKSTITYLLDRLLDLEPDCGTITIGGKDIRYIRREWLRSHIGIVLQEPYLYSRTIVENIGITRRSPDLSEVRRVADIACLDESVMSFSDGYDTVVGERGVTLSGGQKQRAAIARMLLVNAPVMIFDDSLSAVDAKTDAEIRHRLQKEFGSATVILISHRISSLMQADCIMVLDRGTVAEMGTHEELIAKEGIYHRIWQLQSGEPEDDVSVGAADAAKEVL